MGGFPSRLLFGVFPAAFPGMFLSGCGATIGGTTLPAITWAIFVPFFTFTAQQYKFHSPIGILLDPVSKFGSDVPQLCLYSIAYWEDHQW